MLKILVCHRLLAPGSEWALHRQWFWQMALADLLGEDEGVAKDTLYRCLDRLLAHKRQFFTFLRERWQTLFGASFDVLLLYDLTSTVLLADLLRRHSNNVTTELVPKGRVAKVGSGRAMASSLTNIPYGYRP